MATAEALVNVLRSWIGITENPAHSNQTPIGTEYGWNGVAWCAETVSVAHKHVGMADLWTAGVADAIAKAKRGEHGLAWIPHDGQIRPGDHSCFDWGGRGDANQFHISTVIDAGTQQKFRTIGGNENDAVTDQWRDRTYVQGFIRPAYDAAPPPPPAPAPHGDTLRHGESLQRGQEMHSASGQYALALQGSDGHLVLYKSGSPAWSVSSYGGQALSMQDDDNLVLYGSGGHALWATGTQHAGGSGHCRVVLQDDGNLVVYTDADRPVWARR